MRVIAYAYDAEHHCISCAEKAFPGITLDDGTRYEDSEGNEPHPVFDTDEWYEIADDSPGVVLACGDCGEIIEEVDLT